MTRWSALLVVLLALGGAAAAQGDGREDPRLTRRVTDLTETLSPSQRDALEERLAAIQNATSNQIVVVIIPSLEGGSIEETAYRIARENGVGKKDRNNGVLLLIARDDRKIRIEVGYGLEGALPDALAGTIIRHEITPPFRGGDYYGGLLAGIEAIDAATRNEYTPDPQRTGKGTGSGIFSLLFMLLILFFVMKGMGRRSFLGRGGMIPPIGGGFGGGFGRGGGFGGGGFSGGGGSFGGGGASGSW